MTSRAPLHASVALAVASLVLMSTAQLPTAAGADRLGVTATPSKQPAPRRIALLIACQVFRNDGPEGQPYFSPLSYTARDAVLLYSVLKEPGLGGFDEVRVLARWRDLDNLLDEEEKIRQNPPNAGAFDDAVRIIKAINDIQLNSDLATPEQTVNDKLAMFPQSESVADAIQDFANDLQRGDQGLLYISSHGYRTEPGKGNLLNLSTISFAFADTAVTGAGDEVLASRDVPLRDVLEVLDGSRAAQILVVHATCAGQYVPPSVRKRGGTKAAGATVVQADRALQSITVIGASKEAAQENPSVRQDLFTYFFRLALQRPERLGPGWTRSRVDLDRDNAISVFEAYEAASAASIAQGQIPYIVEADRGWAPMILSGRPIPGRQQPVIYPPVGVPSPRGHSKGISSGQIRMRVDGKAVETPTAVKWGVHRVELVDESGVMSSQEYDLQAGDQLRWEEVFRGRVWSIETGIGWAQWAGPAAYTPDNDQRQRGSSSEATADRVHSWLWGAATLDVGLFRTLKQRQRDGWSLQAGGMLQLGAGPAVLPNSITGRNALYGLGLEARGVWKPEFKYDLELSAGLYAGGYFLDQYEYRAKEWPFALGPVLSVNLRTGKASRLSLGARVGLTWGDLDCWPQAGQELLQGDPTGDLYQQTAFRCNAQVSADGSMTVMESPGIYALLNGFARWEWRY